MSSRTFSIDAMTRHQIYLQRYGTGQVRRMIPYINKMLSDVKIRLSVGNFTEFGRVRLSVLQRDLTQIINASMSEMGKALNVDLVNFGQYEAEFSRRLIDSMSVLETGGISLEQISAAITTNKMSLVSGGKTVRLTIEQAINQLSRSASRGIRHAITTGIAQGKTTKEIEREIRRLIKGRTAAQTEAVIRTAANHAGTQARNRLYQENSDVLTGEEFVATLDSRTSDVCAGNDGKIFPVGKGSMPPLHYNCRSIRIPVVDPDFVVGDLKGDRPSFGAAGAQKVSGTSNFSGWLRKQPKSFQDDYFSQFKDGAAKAKLFRNGGLPMEAFINKKNISYSLAQLKRLELAAFKRAFPAKVVKPKVAPKPAAKPKAKPKEKPAVKTVKVVKPEPPVGKIKPMTKKEANVSLGKDTAKAAKDPRYVLEADGKPMTRFRGARRKRGVSVTDQRRALFGKTNIATLTDEAASVVHATVKEANKIAARYGVQPIRGVNTGAASNAAASMGDGILNLKKSHFNKYASSVKAAKKKIAKEQAKIAAIEAELKELERQLAKARADGIPYAEYSVIARKYNRKVDSFNRNRRNFNDLVPPSQIKPSKWKVGDPRDKRPFSAKEYHEDNIDKLRSTIYHEMGHHLHQQFNVLTRADYRNPPLEQLLSKKFNDRVVTPTKYAGTNFAEWFAENFSLYHMGRLDLVDPWIIELLESMENGTFDLFSRGLL